MSTALAIPSRNVGEDEHGQDRGEGHHRRLGRDQDASLGQRIRGDPGE
jgi:hypothetical protein